MPSCRTGSIGDATPTGMLQHRRFHIVLVDANSGAGDHPMQASKSVEYDGKAVKVQL